MDKPTSITKIKDLEVFAKVYENLSRTSSLKEFKNFKFTFYRIESNSYKWHAITSNDKRIGNVVAIIESEYQEDISNNDFAVMYEELLKSYAQLTADLWNSITDSDLANYSVRSTYEPIVTDPRYEYSNWQEKAGNKLHILKTKWDQSPEPFNDCLIAIKGLKDQPVGCGAVQVAQIMAFHKYPVNLYSPNHSMILKKCKKAKTQNWNGKYDWSILTSEPTPDKYSSDNLQVQLSASLYDVAEGCKSSYETKKKDNNEKSTSTFLRNRLKYLKRHGYRYKNVSGYSLKYIKQSIDAGCPVPVDGYAKDSEGKSGHAFIVDGYYTFACQATKKTEPDKPIDFEADFVHCNAGWGGIRDGYYLSGVFSMGIRPPLADDKYESAEPWNGYYFKYQLKQVNKLRPRR